MKAFVGRAEEMLVHAIFLLSMLCLALLPPSSTLQSASGTLVVIGLIGLWRYVWAAINLSRAAIYINVAFPRLRARRTQEYATVARRDHAYFLVTSYKIAPSISTRVYRSIFEAAYHSKNGATVVASIVNEADGRLIRQVFASVALASHRPNGHVALQIDKIAGTGKRDALANSLKSIAQLCPTQNDIVLLVDGDSCVPIDVIEKSVPFFIDPAVGAVTSDEESDTEGGKLFRDWFKLRFAQRHVMMSSMALGGKVLTLTGRMSIFRAHLATDPTFIQQVRSDYIDHWRLGRVHFLTGDDKSTWFWLLNKGYNMLYLPDIQTVSIETQPKPGFYSSATTLMTRWFGNMLRTNNRALGLPASRIGIFTWLSLLDQQASIWTTMIGPISVLLASVAVSPWVLVAYAAWVMFTRYLMCVLIMSFRGEGFSISFPFLLYFSQTAGAITKSFIMFRLDRQKWTRQDTADGITTLATMGQKIRAYSSTHMHALALGWLITAVAYFNRLI
jgi:mannuronan synthase